MADEPVAEASAGEVTQTEATATTTEQTTEAQTQETTPEPVKAEEPQEDWKDKEIRRKHAKIKEFEREVERIKRERDDAMALAQARAEGEETPPQEQPRQISQDEIQRQARALRDQERYQEQLVSTNSAGETTYGKKWAEALDGIASFSDGKIDPADMTAILNTDNPAKVIYELGMSNTEYHRVMSLPPARRLTEFVKISMKQDAPKPAPKVSSAPPPTEPVGNRASPETDLRSEKISDEAWYAKRRADKKERFEYLRSVGRA